LNSLSFFNLLIDSPSLKKFPSYRASRFIADVQRTSVVARQESEARGGENEFSPNPPGAALARRARSSSAGQKYPRWKDAGPSSALSRDQTADENNKTWRVYRSAQTGSKVLSEDRFNYSPACRVASARLAGARRYSIQYGERCLFGKQSGEAREAGFNHGNLNEALSERVNTAPAANARTKASARPPFSLDRRGRRALWAEGEREREREGEERRKTELDRPSRAKPSRVEPKQRNSHAYIKLHSPNLPAWRSCGRFARRGAARLVPGLRHAAARGRASLHARDAGCTYRGARTSYATAEASMDSRRDAWVKGTSWPCRERSGRGRRVEGRKAVKESERTRARVGTERRARARAHSTRCVDARGGLTNRHCLWALTN